jgi:carboxyl-terminal processing protease
MKQITDGMRDGMHDGMQGKPQGGMGRRARAAGLVGIGVVAGLALSLQFPALAQKAGGMPLPLDELRQLADVYGLIKSDYVEPVEDRKLLSEAITGMVASPDPHSVYSDKKSYKEMRESMKGRSSDSASKSRPRTATTR